MDTDEEKIFIRQIKEAIAKSRGYADHYGWFPNRDLEEYGIVKAFCEALEKESKSFLDINSIMMRGRGNDPPDCEAKDVDGNNVGIEVTELVDPAAIIAFRKENIYNWAEWDKDKLLNAINTRLDKKNTRTRIKGGPYSKYILIIHTDEPILNVDYANGLLNNYYFARRDLIDRAFLLISYDPRYKTDPIIELEFKGT
jgi:hypothetical protein